MIIFTGRALNHLGRPDEAETAYRAAKHLLPRGKPGMDLLFILTLTMQFHMSPTQE